MSDKRVKVIKDDNPVSFERRVNEMLSEGWYLSATSCSTVGMPDNHGFIYSFVAILILSED